MVYFLVFIITSMSWNNFFGLMVPYMVYLPRYLSVIKNKFLSLVNVPWAKAFLMCLRKA